MVVQEVALGVAQHRLQGREAEIFLGRGAKQGFDPGGIKGFGGKPPRFGSFLCR